MSDRFPELRRSYERDVGGRQLAPYGKALFPIPERPEQAPCARAAMWPAALGAALSPLRCLAPLPALLLTVCWGQHSLLYKLLKRIDTALRSMLFSNDAQKATVLRWLSEAGPVRVEGLAQVWQHGWILCGAVNVAMPGACAGHRRGRTSIEHAQRLAEQYLGVEPVFTSEEFEALESLSKHQEWKLIHYLDGVRQALAKLSPPVSKPSSTRTAQDALAYTLDYVARGIGLYTAQATKKMYFKIYPTAQQCLEPAEINILIRGPQDTYGTAVIPPIHGRAQQLRQAFLGVQVQSQYTENASPLTQGTGYYRSYGKNDLTKAYFIPKVKNHIEVEVSIRRDHARVTYKAHLKGNYEISLISRGYNLIGSPFKVTALDENLGYNTSTELDDEDECGIIEVNNDRRVVFRIVDFVTEKMLLNENGTLEKISDEDASKLLAIAQREYDNKDLKHKDVIFEGLSVKPNHDKRFKAIANKVFKIVQVCDAFKTVNKKNEAKIYYEIISNQNNEIPDIVNSMIFDQNADYDAEENRIEDLIDYQATQTGKSTDIESPKAVSQSNLTKIGDFKNSSNENSKVNIILQNRNISSSGEQIVDAPKWLTSQVAPQTLCNINSADNSIERHAFHDDHAYSQLNNPFVHSIKRNEIKVMMLNSSIESENISKMESISPCHEEKNFELPAIQIIETDDDNGEVAINPFLDNEIIERPKTPVLKIITDEITDREGSVYVDPAYSRLNYFDADEELRKSNEFLNPIFVHKIFQNTTDASSKTSPDFIIGAPVSLPPFLRARSPEPDMDSIILAPNLEKALQKYDKKVLYMKQTNDVNIDTDSSRCAPPSQETKNDDFGKTLFSDETKSTFYSTECNNTGSKTLVESSLALYNEGSYECSNEHVKACKHKDLWDSAYVSIDEPNSSPDSNNNETPYKHKTFLNYVPTANLGVQEDFFNMGPAEREIWQKYADAETIKLEEVTLDVQLPDSSEYKRKTFTPILEESDINVPIVTKESEKEEPDNKENDSITAALADLNDIYSEYFISSEISSLCASTEKDNFQSFEVNFSVEDKGVNSASELREDVKRHYKDSKKESISEVQSNVAESVSASRALKTIVHGPNKDMTQSKNCTVFGKYPNGNLVIERKKYWDDKIKLIEEIKQQQNRRKKMASKQLKHDSLSKRKGKNIVKNLLNTTGSDISNHNNVIIDHSQPGDIKKNMEKETEVKIVNKWKKYWDDKLETEETISSSFYFPVKKTTTIVKDNSPSNKPNSTVIIDLNSANLTKEEGPKNISSAEETQIQPEVNSPIKHDITDEKLFKAFETSPKRFFGTSRKNILDKIDSFLGKQNTTNKVVTRFSGTHSHGNGIVSSRISMFNTSDGNIIKSYDSIKSLQKTPSICDIHINKIASFARKDNEFQIVDKCNSKGTNEVSPPKNITTKQDQEIINNNVTIKTTICTSIIKNQLHNKRKLSTSKSEMDIFNKTQTKCNNENLDYRKSCENLPKVNVKNVITLFERVTKSEANKNNIYNAVVTSSKNVDTCALAEAVSEKLRNPDTAQDMFDATGLSKNKKDSANVGNVVTGPIIDQTDNTNSHKKSPATEEIIDTTENRKEEVNVNPSSNARNPEAMEYTERFKMAKQFFQSLEELPGDDTDNSVQLNECEMILHRQSPKSRLNKKRTKTIKAQSAPTPDSEYDTSPIGEQDRCGTAMGGRRLIKISEKFNVEDLFNDVAGEGKLSRKGSFRGIPNKQAVLAAFKSMENINTQLTSYEMSKSQLSDFAQKNKIVNAQTHLTEYPYLPRTEPAHCHSRVDGEASGLISRKELLHNSPRRRNSVPDVLRLNE